MEVVAVVLRVYTQMSREYLERAHSFSLPKPCLFTIHDHLPISAPVVWPQSWVASLNNLPSNPSPTDNVGSNEVSFSGPHSSFSDYARSHIEIHSENGSGSTGLFMEIHSFYFISSELLLRFTLHASNIINCLTEFPCLVWVGSNWMILWDGKQMARFPEIRLRGIFWVRNDIRG